MDKRVGNKSRKAKSQTRTKSTIAQLASTISSLNVDPSSVNVQAQAEEIYLQSNAPHLEKRGAKDQLTNELKKYKEEDLAKQKGLHPQIPKVMMQSAINQKMHQKPQPSKDFRVSKSDRKNQSIIKVLMLPKGLGSLKSYPSTALSFHLQEGSPPRPQPPHLFPDTLYSKQYS